MELHEFISRTLQEITMGVVDAQNKLAGLNRVDPGRSPAVNPLKVLPGQIPTNEGLREVDFDIAVTVTESKDGSAAAKAGISVLGFTGELHQEISQSKVSRIKFQIPIRFSGGHV